MGESTLRSQLDAEHLTQVVARGGGAIGRRVRVDTDPGWNGAAAAGADAQEALMQVRDLDGRLVNGYRSFNVLGMGADGERGLLYHRLFSSEEDDFRSENTEWRQALAETEACLAGHGGVKTWVMDRGFDNDEVWWWIWDHSESHVVWRAKHLGRVVLWRTAEAQWDERYLEATFEHLQRLATAETTLTVRLKGQKRAKRQSVLVDMATVPGYGSLLQGTKLAPKTSGVCRCPCAMLARTLGFCSQTGR